MWLLELLPCWWKDVFFETCCLDWMCRVWMWAMSTIHESPWILHRIINTCSIYSMSCNQNLCQPPSMKLKLIEVFFWGGRLDRIILPFCGRLRLWDPPVFAGNFFGDDFQRWLCTITTCDDATEICCFFGGNRIIFLQRSVHALNNFPPLLTCWIDHGKIWSWFIL